MKYLIGAVGTLLLIVLFYSTSPYAGDNGVIESGLVEVDFDDKTMSFCAFHGVPPMQGEDRTIHAVRCITHPLSEVKNLHEDCMFVHYFDGSGDILCGKELDEYKTPIEVEPSDDGIVL
jgi:hypothetical protein